MARTERDRHGSAILRRHNLRRHNLLLFRTARGILNDDAETEDAVQDAYIDAWRVL